jgi:hypothetical protein
MACRMCVLNLLLWIHERTREGCAYKELVWCLDKAILNGQSEQTSNGIASKHLRQPTQRQHAFTCNVSIQLKTHVCLQCRYLSEFDRNFAAL